MVQRTTWWVALALVLLTGCLKDGVEPPEEHRTSSLEVLFDTHCGGQPFHADSIYVDWSGTRVRFDHLQFTLVGLVFMGDEGQVLGERPDVVLHADITGAKAPEYVDLTGMHGEIHWLDSRTLALGDSSSQAAEHSWTQCGPVTRLASLELRGTFDGNGDGDVDDADPDFRVVVQAGHAPVDLRIHTHTSLEAAAPAMAIAVNIPALLNGIDLADAPVTLGSGPNAIQLIENFRTVVLGVDNKPL